MTFRELESSDVLPPESVAVAVIRRPVGTFLFGMKMKVACPAGSVSTLMAPRNRLPSAGSPGGVEKNRRVRD